MVNPAVDPLVNLVAETSIAARRRQSLKQWRSRVRTEESRWFAALQSATVDSVAELPTNHSLIEDLGPTAVSARQRLLECQQSLVAARAEALAARARKPPIEVAIARLSRSATSRRRFAVLAIVLGVALCIAQNWLPVPWTVAGLTFRGVALGGITLGAATVGGISSVSLGLLLIIAGNGKRAIRAAGQRLAAEQAAENAATKKLLEAKTQAHSEVKVLAEASAAFFARQFESDARTWRTTFESLPPFLKLDWSEAAWKSHDFRRSHRLPYVVAGALREDPPESPTPFQLPFFAPFLGEETALLVSGREDATTSFLHGMILQLATVLPYCATFTLIDPAGAGRAFPMQRSLPFVRRLRGDLYRDLESILEDITRIIHTYIDDQTSSFEQLPEQVQANERFEFLFVANFPDGYDRRTIEALQKIAKNGPLAGKYMILQQSVKKELPKDLSWEGFGKMWAWDFDHTRWNVDMDGCVLEALSGPQGQAQSVVLQALERAKPPETKVTWMQLAESDPAKWWGEESSARISAPVGSSGRDRKLTIWFGVQKDGRPCAHGILGAMPGAGKSNLYHVLICGLAIRYSPEELNLYLIDGKVGVEFQPYRRLPHARVVALHSSAELSRSVLRELIDEMKRRNEIFKSADVADLLKYQEAGSPAGKLPRIVLLIDEYQELFEDDRLGLASDSLLQLAQQGRSAGIHMLLGSQRFGAVGMLHQTAIFGSIHLRMAMKMSQSDVQALAEFGRDGKRLVEQCDLPGKIVVNDQSGEDKANEFGKVALLEPVDRARILDALVRKAEAEWASGRRFSTVVFDGHEQPDFAENPQLQRLLRHPSRPVGEEMRRIATVPTHEQGLGIDDWFPSERPMALWLGQELNMHGQARIVLRRRSMENVLFVGENQPAVYGMLASLTAAVPCNVARTEVEVWIADRAVPGTPWEGALEEVVNRLLAPAGYRVRHTREAKQVATWLDECCAEMDRRTTLSAEELQEAPIRLLVLAGADRLPGLLRTQNKFGAFVESSDGEKVRRIGRDGPTLGLHLVMTFPAAGPLKQVLDRPQIELFKHRVTTQMAEADSFLLLGRDHAAKLQRGSARPAFAIYLDTSGGEAIKFKPYTIESQPSWSDLLDELGARLKRW